MRAGMKLVTGPTSEPFQTETMKKFLRVEVPDDDDLITDLITGARDYIEDQTGFIFLTQTWDQTMDNFPYMSGAIELLRHPLQSITSVTYVDASGQTQTLSSSLYVSSPDTKPPRLAPVYGQFWPLLILQTLSNVKVRFVAGATSPPLIPRRALHALRMLIGHWYENRSAVEMERGTILVAPDGTDSIIAPLRPALYA